MNFSEQTRQALFMSYDDYSTPTPKIEAPVGHFAESNPNRPPLPKPQQRNQVKRRLDMEHGSPVFKTPSPVVHSKKIKLIAPKQESPQNSLLLPSLSSREGRVDTSLGKLTRKFIDLIRAAQDGLVDLNQASEVLSVQKRRIYDITNVLEGIGLIEKKQKNVIRWKPQNEEGSSRQGAQLQLDLKELENKEHMLDELLKSAASELEKITDTDGKQWGYVTYADMQNIPSLRDQTVVAIKAPPDTKLEVPDVHDKIQMFLRSDRGPIEVFVSADGMGHNHPASDTSENTAPEYSLTASSVTTSDTTSHDQAGTSATNLLDDDPLPYRTSCIPGQISPTDEMVSRFITPFVNLQPTLSEEDFNFTLADGEGITDLFDDYLVPFQ
ncbi:transcription factor E2F6-like isoform X2 [Varroa jacobsoni]|uniref:E2F/DP family winged-helix DNA-binding domain-containing protein n=1 Tax=Varroa destructor TaxID=109461 RepID=A0A7M7KK06_VARDE|nr:transcription factor E2F6-like [Varroa destructor]XP_022697910.1 transcription factor E2F6-like isoform X2 [Varroa jacobsoni]